MPSASGAVTYRELEFPNLCIGNGSNIIRNNIHVDNRVVRGNTFASIVLTANQKRNKEAKERESNRLLSATKTYSTHALTNNRKGNTRTAQTLPPVDGRHHMEIQTDNYIEEIMDHLLAERCTCSSAQTSDSLEEARTNTYSVFVLPSMTEDKETQVNDTCEIHHSY